MEGSPHVSVDDLIIQLLDMGFEKNDCEEALAAGKYNIAEALEWLLQGKPSMISGPTLVLRKNVGSQFDQTILDGKVLLTDKSNSQSTSTNLPLKDNRISNEFAISSRLAAAEENKLKYEAKLQKEAEASAKKARIEKKKHHESVMEKIAADKNRKKLLSENLESKTLCSEDKIIQSTSTGVSHTRTENASCFIQIRCPTGRVLKGKFLPDEILYSLWEFISKEGVDCENMVLFQPFPKYEFTADDLNKTFAALSLSPSSSLVLKSQNKLESQEDIHIRPSLMDVVGSSNSSETNLPNREESHCNLSHSSNSSLGELRASPENHEENRNVIRINDAIVHHDHLPGIREQVLLPLHLWGDGQRLGGQNINGQNVALINSGLAAEQRQCQVSPSSEQIQFSLMTTPVITSLHDMCLHFISKQILQPGFVDSLHLPAQVAEHVIHHMIKEKTLKPHHMQHFISCHLTNLCLDYFPYTTNELLYSLRYYTSLLHLSLVSCSLINDKGFQALSSLRRLNYINLRGCNQLTDNCFSVLAEMPLLNTLILEGTKISDNGIKEFLSVVRKNLMVLNLNKTIVSSDCFQYFENLPNLHILKLNGTKITSLELLPILEKLEGLSFQGTAVETAHLAFLCKFPNLTHLNIADTLNIKGDEGLHLISALKLIYLQLPARLTTTNQGLYNIVGMPLISLDLTNYINIDDKGIVHIGKIVTLKHLHLTNTKLTDEGLLALKDLQRLEVFYLDRTSVTDAGTFVFKGMCKLLELSLACTSIKGRYLINVLSCCPLLMKLNLSRTKVTTKVLKGLTLPNLNLLNCDGSRLSGDLSQLFIGCPLLKHLNARNLQPYDPLRNDSDSE